MFAQPIFGDCPVGAGQFWTPTNTNLGISMPESEHLGKVYTGKAEDGSIRLYRIVKNASGATLTKGQLLKWSTSAGRFLKDVTVTTGDTQAPAGVVDDTYDGGVADGKWFRMVVYATRIQLKMQTASSARCTLANGDPIVSGATNGTFLGQNSAASNAAVQNRFGRVLVATTDGTENATFVVCEVNIAW